MFKFLVVKISPFSLADSIVQMEKEINSYLVINDFNLRDKTDSNLLMLQQIAFTNSIQ